MPITWCLADPKIGEREVCLDLLTIAVETGLLAPGSTVLADKGLAGREIETQIAELGVRMLRPDRRDEPARHGTLGGIRQWIESIYDTLKGQLSLERHGARTPHGLRHPRRPNACSAWPPRSGTTGPPAPETSAASPPTTTDQHRLHGIDHGGGRMRPLDRPALIVTVVPSRLHYLHRLHQRALDEQVGVTS